MLGVLVLLGVVGVEAIFIFNKDGAFGSQEFCGKEDSCVGSVWWNTTVFAPFFPVAKRRHSGHDRKATKLNVERQFLKVVGHNVNAAVFGEEHLQHPRILHWNVATESSKDAGRHL